MIQPTVAPSLDGFRVWSERCRACDGDVRRAGAALVELAASVPRGLTVPQQVTARALLNEAWTRLLSLAVPPSSVDNSVTPTNAVNLANPGNGDPRIASALTELDRRYADPRFRLRRLARQLAVSDCRLTQMLKQATGLTFGAHLHARRVAEARLLLADGTLSVKEVAGRVGYSTTTQLDRHFKKIVGHLPSQCRAAAVRRDAADGASVPRAR